LRDAGVIAVEIEFQVAFHDVDMVGVVWHGHYLRYFENARWALMDRLGFGLDRMLESGYAWPIIDMQARYIQPARFGDRLRARAALVEWENRLLVNYLVTQAASGTRVARGRSVQVAVDGRTGEMQFSCPTSLVERVRASLT
jgi:acyl-CoA thioester hydrolase